jgi:hypothetical protein
MFDGVSLTQASIFVKGLQASVVMSSDATEAAFCGVERTTLVGSMTPDSKRSSNLSVWAL